MHDDPPRSWVTEFGDEGQELRAERLALFYPEGWEAQVHADPPRVTAILTGPGTSTAFVMVQLLGIPLPESARAVVAQHSRAGVANGLVGGLDGPAQLEREEPTRATFLGAEHPGHHLIYGGTADGEEVSLAVDLFVAGLVDDTALLVVASRDEDRDDAVNAFALVAASLTLDV